MSHSKAEHTNSTMLLPRLHIGWRQLAVGLAGLAALALLIGGVYGLAQSPNDRGVVYLALINFNLILIALMVLFVGRKIFGMLIERRKGLAGAGLHVRLLGMFSFLAAMPVIVVAGFSIFFLNLGIEAWFSAKVTKALNGSLEVAQAYFQEHGNRLLTDAESIARDPTISDPTFLIDPQILEEAINQERQARNLAEVGIYTADGTLIAHAGELAPMTNQEVQEVIRNPEFSSRLFADYNDGRIVAIAPINNEVFLVLTRWVAQPVLNHMDSTRDAYQEYYELRSERGRAKLAFSLLFSVTTVLILSVAIWLGLSMASRIVRPVRSLVTASNQVREGDLNVQVEVMDNDEIGTLAVAFNQMTASMAENQRLLESKNRELDERRQAMVAVLTGVSAGVLSVDNKGIVWLANRTARRTFDVREGTNFIENHPEFTNLLETFFSIDDRMISQQVRVEVEGENRILLVRMVAQEYRGDKKKTAIITFDDISDLLSAQRVAAWADVARRLAHEIKNPLTPIQLSAERIRRKYGKQITEDEDIFAHLTSTIVTQVEEMRQMLNEFSDFARMPAAEFVPLDVKTLVRDIVQMEQEVRTKIKFDLKLCSQPAIIMADGSHLRRLFINLLENAVNAIEENEQKNEQGHIKVVVKEPQSGKIAIVVEDNGKGFSKDMDLEKLFDPYVTTRKKGTGLGLAIVRKVVDEHEGYVKLQRGKKGGARIELTFPLSAEEEENPSS